MAQPRNLTSLTTTLWHTVKQTLDNLFLQYSAKKLCTPRINLMFRAITISISPMKRSQWENHVPQFRAGRINSKRKWRINTSPSQRKWKLNARRNTIVSFSAGHPVHRRDHYFAKIRHSGRIQIERTHTITYPVSERVKEPSIPFGILDPAPKRKARSVLGKEQSRSKRRKSYEKSWPLPPFSGDQRDGEKESRIHRRCIATYLINSSGTSIGARLCYKRISVFHI